MEKKIRYEIDGRSFEGMLVCDESVPGRRPAVLMQPDWAGVCPDTLEQARRLAGREYVVFMADMYGAGYGEKPKSFDQLMAASRALRNDHAFTLKGGSRALEILLEEGGRAGLIDAGKTAAVGYCAGGGLALEHARSGAGLRAVVVFHVTHPSPLDPQEPCRIKGRVLVIHGSADPVTPRPAIHALEDELSAAGVPWQTVMFGGAVHSFTDPQANLPGRNQYDAALAARSYALSRDFLNETFAT